MNDWRQKGLELIDLIAIREKAYREYLQKLDVLTAGGPDLPREEIGVICGFIAQRLEDLHDINSKIDKLTEEFKRGQ